MPIKNIMEDIVLSVVDRVIREENTFADAIEFKQDVAAYVLNRIPSKYVTSERGVLHSKLESKFFVQQKTDILLLVHEALSIITKRRIASSIDFESIKKKKKLFSPHLIGEVLEETTFSIVPDINVYLLLNGHPYIVYWLRKVVFSILILEKLRASRLNEGLGHYSFSISSDCL